MRVLCVDYAKGVILVESGGLLCVVGVVLYDGVRWWRFAMRIDGEADIWANGCGGVDWLVVVDVLCKMHKNLGEGGNLCKLHKWVYVVFAC